MERRWLPTIKPTELKRKNKTTPSALCPMVHEGQSQQKKKSFFQDQPPISKKLGLDWHHNPNGKEFRRQKITDSESKRSQKGDTETRKSRKKTKKKYLARDGSISEKK